MDFSGLDNVPKLQPDCEDVIVTYCVCISCATVRMVLDLLLGNHRIGRSVLSAWHREGRQGRGAFGCGLRSCNTSNDRFNQSVIRRSRADTTTSETTQLPKNSHEHAD